ncbi:MAG: hypothetical protein QOC78_2079, partial [Solirubrobacteraceae bacterium]|nr:hypothetical protein [Solirubrobacteraceae bacterium]
MSRALLPVLLVLGAALPATASAA